MLPLRIKISYTLSLFAASTIAIYAVFLNIFQRGD